APTTGSNGSFTGADWVGVYQTVTALIHPDGSTDKTPTAATKISVAGSEPATVQVPVADSSVTVKHDGHFKNKTPSPTVTNQEAHVTVGPDGIAGLEPSSKFTQPLPVSVCMTYQLNGQPVSDSVVRNHFNGVKGKSGTVQVTYTLTNTTTAPVATCFQ